eukprot:TRINITY_DN6084_c0_g1_i2.p1 TRINITY_DN6084_c0_g1~~TRINITY_DN6084_c0_g1_i2.p1  ORF type:complete len:547 (+),score=100.33 TRINITY_DN6084_c0_g1_i2:177-1643(+)
MPLTAGSSSSSPNGTRDVRRCRTEQKEAVKKLPDMRRRIKAMGLEDEYEEFRERYMGWRQGKSKGAPGEFTATELSCNSKLKLQDFGKWYPNLKAWKWRRTISFWIGITFFEGSIFFTVSSFLYNDEQLGRYKRALTLGGYMAGKVHFIVCTYLMCLETINLSSADHKGDDSEASSEDDTCPESRRSDFAILGDVEEHDEIKLNPFRVRTAVRNLERMGAGPWPYYASLIYFTGVLTFLVGMIAEMTPGLPEEIAEPTLVWAFVLGSVQFTLGGAAECIENEVFSCKCNFSAGYVGAALNLFGGICFLAGSLCPVFTDQLGYWANVLFGIGSVGFLLGSSVMLIMWRDEQYGLTFLAVINKLGGPHGKPLVEDAEKDEPQEQVSFSIAGIFFIHVYCLCGAASTYNFMVELVDAFDIGTVRRYQLAFNELLPCIFCHMTIALRSAVVRTPQAEPYFSLFAMMRIVAVLMTLSSVWTFIEFLDRQEILV